MSTVDHLGRWLWFGTSLKTFQALADTSGGAYAGSRGGRRWASHADVAGVASAAA